MTHDIRKAFINKTNSKITVFFQDYGFTKKVIYNTISYCQFTYLKQNKKMTAYKNISTKYVTSGVGK